MLNTLRYGPDMSNVARLIAASHSGPRAANQTHAGPASRPSTRSNKRGLATSTIAVDHDGVWNGPAG